jgi:putative transposase
MASYYSTLQVKVNPDNRITEYCKFLQQESARVWNRTVNFFWRTYRKKDIWLSANALMMYNRNDQLGTQFSLHSQSVQSVIQQFDVNRKTARKLRKDNPTIRYPHKTKRYFRVHWKQQALRVNGRNIKLSNGKGNQPLKLRLPKSLADCQPKTVELIWRNGYWLSLTVKVNDSQTVTGNNVAAIDMGEIHAISMTDGYDALVISGRKLREAKQYRNKRMAQLQQAMSKCKRHSRKWRKLNRTKRRLMAKTHRRIKNLNHKITTSAIDWCVEHNVSTIVIGDLSGIAQSTTRRLRRKARQKISQWSFYKQKEYLRYKAERLGIEVVEVSEAYTSRTCPRCGTINKPANRNYSCPNCNLQCHRDVVGAYNILTKHQYGTLVPNDLFPYPEPKYLRIPFVPKGKSSSSPDGGLMVARRHKSMCDLACAANR